MSLTGNTRPLFHEDNPNYTVWRALSGRGPKITNFSMTWPHKENKNKWEQKDIDDIVRWELSDFETFTTTFYKQLNEPMELPRSPLYPEEEALKDGAEGMKGVVERVFNTVDEAFQVPRRNSPRPPQLTFRKYAKLSVKSHTFQIVTAGINVQTDIWIVGFAYPGEYWNSSALEKEDASEYDLLPLKHLAYCTELTKTRFGIIATEREVVVVEFHPHQNTPNSPRVSRATWLAVPWSVEKDDQNTANMAIWALLNLAWGSSKASG